ncbi:MULTISPECIES: hypothetical protein [Rathayibacter]|uniref:Uncharacterized protein n=2 Tax=Rathayibacter festucae TaxID=110937 RepID=A0A3Q9UYQ5_9MICO|nr:MULTISPECIES: hypothetical protein [Rathayibacter]AZZ53376.1 hypothetical protein C1I64_15930 [Rathayibacter festucae DSM 15932]MCJ1688777.1 hypothetical protein [Rathayibacter sp. VKM Ac-2927]MCJ1698220.1 hypothetical protein [Rathayibacter festucae]MCJ1703128.1 hypothetical protein [Rathayibacter sp. VKM Ac-2926]NRG42114.1 hypothetical protein [Rathayibacter sp. VKM Ac-2835]
MTAQSTTATQTSTAPETAQRPRIRAGAVVWGLVQAVVAVLLLLVAADAGLRTAVVDWALSLGPAGAAAIAIAALGTIALLIGLVRVLDRR